jgi:hypothetical protein
MARWKPLVVAGHVVAGAIHAKPSRRARVKTLGGAESNVAIANGKVSFGGANVVMIDSEATNGLVHASLAGLETTQGAPRRPASFVTVRQMAEVTLSGPSCAGRRPAPGKCCSG